MVDNDDYHTTFRAEVLTWWKKLDTEGVGGENAGEELALCS